MNQLGRLIDGMAQGNDWDLMGNSDAVRELLDEVYAERYHGAAHHRAAYQLRVNLKGDRDAACYAGWITAENPKSGPYQGTSFVWFPGTGGSVAVLVVGTDGFGSDTAILGRPGHARRLRALSRISGGKVWVKPDLLDISSEVPDAVIKRWPEIASALKSYSRYIYAATEVRSREDLDRVSVLLDLFFHEHRTPLTGNVAKAWTETLSRLTGAIFPRVEESEVLAILRERRFVIIEGPPGTGKTRMAYSIAKTIGSSTMVQFHAARTYEDFVIGLYPRVTEAGLAFEVRKGDLVVANERAAGNEHLLVADEINRADLARVLGEAISLFEPGEVERSVRLPQPHSGDERTFRLSPNLLFLGTRNTADRTISRMDIAIRRRFAFIEMWPDLGVVEAAGVDFATELFVDTIGTFSEFADDETLRLVPGHAYFLDPRPDLDGSTRSDRVARRIRYELLPLLRDYLDERMCGGASEQIAGLADRVESRLLDP